MEQVAGVEAMVETVDPEAAPPAPGGAVRKKPKVRLWVPEAETSDPATGSPGLSVTSDSCALAPSKWTPGQGWRGGGGEGEAGGESGG